MIRINDEIKKETSELIRGELKDPRISALTSVTKVDTSTDLSICKVYVSVFGNDEDKKKALEGLKSAGGYIRKELAGRINLRNTPELKFILDDSIEYSAKIDKLIEEANKPKE